MSLENLHIFITVSFDAHLFFLFIPSSLPHPRHLAYLLKEYILSASNVLGTVLGAVDTT